MDRLNPVLRTPLQKQLQVACNPERSQNLGRRIYKVCLKGQYYWLKMHIQAQSADSEQSFLNELDVYCKLSQQNPKILLPYFLINPQLDLNLDVNFLTPALMLLDSTRLFEPPPRALSYSEVITILQKSLDVLDEMHHMGYLHGDLKVEHFRVFKDQCYLIDFEQSHLIDDARLFKNTATPRYMAPELFHAEQKSMQSDIYALGIIWLEWLTEQKLQEKSYIDWAKLHCQRLKVELPQPFKGLEALLAQMLMKIKGNRCSNIYQIKQRLNNNV